VVSSSVSSSRTGWVNTLVPTVTFREDGSGSAAIDDTNFVGGAHPLKGDAGNASTTLAALSTTTAEAQAITPVQLAGNITGLDFGFSFNVVHNTQDSGSGSLRQAMTNANTLGGDASLAMAGRSAAVEHLVFMLPNGSSAAGLRSGFNAFTTPGAGANVATIAPLSPLPAVTNSLVMDAQTQPGWTLHPRIEINAAGVGTGIDALALNASDIVLRGFIVNRSPREGIVSSAGSRITVQGVWSGLDATGTAAAGNRASALWFFSSGSNHQIGGTLPAQRNVLSGSQLYEGLAILGGSGHVIQGNYIGTSFDGTAAVGNNRWGVSLNPGVSNSTFGGTDAAARNVVAGNGSTGVVIWGSNITVQNNRIGTSADGTTALGNSGIGLHIAGTAGAHTIGGVGVGNLISGNGGEGIRVESASATGTTIRGNFIGTRADGMTALPNQGTGVRVDSAAVQVGGSVALGEGNLISGNGTQGVQLNSGANGSVVQGNWIGVAADGSALKNGGDSLQVLCSSGCTVGVSGSGNVITAGTAGHAVLLQGAGSTLRGNFIGTDTSGTHARGTAGFDGINVSGSGHFIGAAGAANVISGNGQHGINVLSGASGPTIVGNFIGTTAAGTAALANTGNGVNVAASGITVGGTATGAGNVISGNGEAGVKISANNATVQGNWIGLNSSGTAAVPNGANLAANGGVWVISGSDARRPVRATCCRATAAPASG
jgi:hypothetical protein